MVTNLNKINKHIKYILEMEINNEICFLNYTVNLIKNKSKFIIYSKFTHADFY